MKIFILYPHGLGDCVLLTPTLRALNKEKGVNCSVATLERFKSAQLFDNNPYVDKIYYTKDAWLDFGGSHIGFAALHKKWKQYAKENDYKGFIMPMHSGPESKIMLSAKMCGISELKNAHTAVYISEEDKEEAASLIKEEAGDEPYGFVHTSTGVPNKDLPPNFGRQWLKENKGLENVIEIGKEVESLSCNINVQFEILRRSAGICVPDSVFYHAAHALDKEVDLVYFARGESVYNRVRPLHEAKENVVYTI
jgi:hypothetical protein